MKGLTSPFCFWLFLMLWRKAPRDRTTLHGASGCESDLASISHSLGLTMINALYLATDFLGHGTVNPRTNEPHVTTR
jgi:hypothetical protein